MAYLIGMAQRPVNFDLCNLKKSIAFCGNCGQPQDYDHFGYYFATCSNCAFEEWFSHPCVQSRIREVLGLSHDRWDAQKVPPRCEFDGYGN